MIFSDLLGLWVFCIGNKKYNRWEKFVMWIDYWKCKVWVLERVGDK